MAKKIYIVYRGKKLALTCGVCDHADEKLTNERSRCVQCLKNNRSKFVLAKKYVDAKPGEEEIGEEE